MLDFVHWSAALLALSGLVLWLWSAGIRAPQFVDPAHFLARRKRQIRRVAICAAVVSALLQAAGASAVPTELRGIDLWASAATADLAPIG